MISTEVFGTKRRASVLSIAQSLGTNKTNMIMRIKMNEQLTELSKDVTEVIEKYSVLEDKRPLVFLIDDSIRKTSLKCVLSHEKYEEKENG